MELGQNWSLVNIATTSSTAAAELKAAASGKVNRIHALSVNLTTAGMFSLQTVSTGSTDTLVGPIEVLADSQWQKPFDPRIDGAIPAPSGQNLQIRSTGANIGGYAIVSQSTA